MFLLKKIIHSLFGLVGLVVRKKPSASSLDVYHVRGRKLLRFLQERNVNVLLDVGANIGLYAQALRELGFHGKIESFEPLAEQYGLLEKRASGDKEWECYRFAVGEEDSEITIKVAGNSESSSILPMLDLHLNADPASGYVSEQTVPMRRLDSVLRRLAESNEKLMMKIDVQGYELKALQGASGLLSNVEIIDIELSLVPLYAGQPSFVEMMAFFESKGLFPVSIENAFTDPRDGHTLQADVIFMRRHA
jgi:FkbM family methyltransferase